MLSAGLSGAACRGRWLHFPKPALTALALWVGVSAGNLTFAFARGISDWHEAAIQWWHSIDAYIPEATANWMLHGGPFLEGWSPFDRGPLQAIVLILSGAVFLGPTGCFIVGVIFNSVWAPGAYCLLRTLGICKKRAVVIVVSIAFVGPIWINTVYPWPKMAAAGFCLFAAGALRQRRPVAASAWMALALLSHGSSLFALVGLLPLAWAWAGPAAAAWVLAAVVPAVVWALGPSVIPAPGEPRLAQWHLAGTDIRDPDRRPLWASIGYSYWEAGFGVVRNKVNNALTVLGVSPWGRPVGGGPLQGWERGGVLNQIRVLSMNHLLLAPGVLLFGLARAARSPRALWLLTAVWASSYILLEWGGSAESAAWLHTAPLAALVTLSLALACAWPVRWLLPVQVCAFVILWFAAPPVFP